MSGRCGPHVLWQAAVALMLCGLASCGGGSGSGSSGGALSSVKFPSTRYVDLLKLQGEVTGSLSQGNQIPAGDYQWIRLNVLADRNTQNESYVTVAQGSTTSLLIEFDLRKSVTAPPGQDPNYVLKPTVRLVDELQVGQIVAHVDLAALTAGQRQAATRWPRRATSTSTRPPTRMTTCRTRQRGRRDITR